MKFLCQHNSSSSSNNNNSIYFKKQKSRYIKKLEYKSYWICAIGGLIEGQRLNYEGAFEYQTQQEVFYFQM